MTCGITSTRRRFTNVPSAVKLLLFGILTVGFVSGQFCVPSSNKPSDDNNDSSSNGNNQNPGGQTVDTFAGEHVLGSSNAPVTVVEYADFQDSLSGRFWRETFPVVEQSYVNTGKVRWVFRQFPVRSIHSQAEKAAQASECAGDQGQFLNYTDLLFNNQGALSEPQLKIYASFLALDQGMFFPCLDGGSKAADVQEDINRGLLAGVTATPAFSIQGKLQSGFFTVTHFKALLDAAITEANENTNSSGNNPIVGPLP